MNPENEEFKTLLDQSGWTPAEASRQLLVKPPSISRYLKGEDRPAHATLKLFRMMVHGIKFGGAERGETFPDIEVPAPASNFNVEDLLSEIAKLRDQVAAVELAAKRLASRPAPSSGRADSAARAAGKYANHIEHSHRKDEPE